MPVVTEYTCRKILLYSDTVASPEVALSITPSPERSNARFNPNGSFSLSKHSILKLAESLQQLGESL